jgi:hypothetical protein
VELDASLRPWLLEVNVCPSLDVAEGDAMSRRVIGKLLADTLHLVGLPLPCSSPPCTEAEALDDEGALIARLSGELRRRGHYRPVYPTAERLADGCADAFKEKRGSDRVLEAWVAESRE